MERVKDIRDVQEVDFSPRAGMDSKDLNYTVDLPAIRYKSVNKGVLAGPFGRSCCGFEDHQGRRLYAIGRGS